MSLPPLPPKPRIPDELQALMAAKPTTGTLPPHRRAEHLARIGTHLTRQLQNAGYDAVIDPHPSGWTMTVDIPNHPNKTTQLDGFEL